MICLAVLGLGGGIVVTGANALVSDVTESRRGTALNLLNIFFGLGGLLTPFVTANLLSGNAIRMCYLAAGLAAAALVVNAVAPMPRPTGERGFKASELGALFRTPGALPALACSCSCTSACEVGVWNWLAKYLSDERGLDKASALNILSLGFALGLLVGRVVVARILVNVIGADGDVDRLLRHGRHHLRNAGSGHRHRGLDRGFLRRPRHGAHIPHHAGDGGRCVPAYERDRHGRGHHLRLGRPGRQFPDHRQRGACLRIAHRPASAADFLGGDGAGECGAAAAIAYLGRE
jgi:hypothetical protein